MRGLLELSVKNYRSLRNVSVRLGPLNVLVGPNGSGKSKLLDVIQFLGDSVRDDLSPAVERRGGFERISYRGVKEKRGASIRIHVKANVTTHAREETPDEYKLDFRQSGLGRRILFRQEQFTFKRVKGRGRRITIDGEKVDVVETESDKRVKQRELSLRSDSLGLSTLPRLSATEGGDEVRKVANLFSSFRVFDVDARAARRPSATAVSSRLEADASNLAAFLRSLSENEETFERLQEDARAIVPGLARLVFRSIGGADEAVALELEEIGLKGRTTLAEASFGTVRALALLALLYDPNPPPLTCVEEIDHGFHPYVFDRLVERIRWASQRTQFLIATHSPSLVNRLKANELIVCERDPASGEARIPAIAAEQVKVMEKAAGSKVRLGELWFTGTLGGVPR